MFYHFLDESGDPGINQSGSSSPYFVLAMVEWSSQESIPTLVAMRRELKLPPDYEFKYQRSRKNLKKIFFTNMQSVSFRVRAIVLDKAAAPTDFYLLSGSGLMINLFVQMTLHIPEADVCDDMLIVDGATPQFKRDLRRQLSQAHHLAGRKRLFKKIVGRKSHHSDGLQLADMAAGAISHHITGKDSSCFHLIQNKVVNLQRVPGIK